jgi:hypothetical protein
MYNKHLFGMNVLTDKTRIGIVYSGRNQEEIAYCQRYLELANVGSKLGNRYLPGEFGNITISPDAECGVDIIVVVLSTQSIRPNRKLKLTSLTEPRDVLTKYMWMMFPPNVVMEGCKWKLGNCVMLLILRVSQA